MTRVPWPMTSHLRSVRRARHETIAARFASARHIADLPLWAAQSPSGMGRSLASLVGSIPDVLSADADVARGHTNRERARRNFAFDDAPGTDDGAFSNAGARPHD